MKNKLLALLIITLSFASCELKEDRIFDETPDQRLNKLIGEYTNMLTSAPNGWFLMVDTDVEGCFRHWVTFDTNNRTVMLSDLDATWRVDPRWGDMSTSVTPRESSYRFRVNQLPSLLFDTYNYLHILSDPQGEDNEYRPGNGGANSTGLKSDYDFYILGINGGSMGLLGRMYGLPAILEPATPADALLANQGGLKTVHQNFVSFVENTYSFPTAEIDGKEVWIGLDNRNTSAMYDTASTTVESETSSYLDFHSLKTSDASSNIIFLNYLKIGNKEFEGAIFKDDKYWLVDTNGHQYEVYDRATPAVALSFGPQKRYTTLRISNTELTGTMKDPFLTNVYMAAYNTLNNNGGGRKMQKVELTFTRNTLNIPMVRMQIPYLSGTTTYTATWWYRYTMSDDGQYITFTDRDQGGSSNENGREVYLKAILDYFCHVPYTSSSGTYDKWVKDKDNIVSKTFKIDWAKNETAGSIELVGSLTPTDPAGNENNVCVGILVK